MNPRTNSGGTAAWIRRNAVWLIVSSCGLSASAADVRVFDVKLHGATGRKSDDARPAIQKAIDACAAAGGGIVSLPPGDYTSGTLHLRSHVQVELLAGATLFAAKDATAYDFGGVPSKASLFFGEDLEDVSLSGNGIVDGQAEYEWRIDDHESAFEHKTLMQTLGKPLMRSFPKDFPKREVFPHLVWLGRSRNVRVTGLRLQASPSWAVTLYDCDRVLLDNLQVHSSLKEAVWSDGIDLDGCRDVLIANCTIATGDDCVVFISTDVWGPARRCENITVTGCHLSSASAGVKFSEGNRAGISRVLVRQCVLTNVNRGFVFSTALGGDISEVVLADLTIHCHRFDWFWAGDGQPFYFRSTRLSEFNKEPPKPGEAPPGLIRNVTIRNVTASARGSSRIQGHSENPCDAIRFENLKIALSADSGAPFDTATNALQFRWATNVTLKEVEIIWEKPALDSWKSALVFDRVGGLLIDGFSGRGAWPEREVAAIELHQVCDALIRNTRDVATNEVFLRVSGSASRDIRLQGADLGEGRLTVRLEEGLKTNIVTRIGEQGKNDE